MRSGVSLPHANLSPRPPYTDRHIEVKRRSKYFTASKPTVCCLAHAWRFYSFVRVHRFEIAMLRDVIDTDIEFMVSPAPRDHTRQQFNGIYPPRPPIHTIRNASRFTPQYLGLVVRERVKIAFDQ
jgi:hypothetical protein